MLTRIQWPITWAEMIEQLCTSRERRAALSEAIAGAPYEAVFWETPAVSRDTLERPFELVLVDAPGLAKVRADARAFAGQFGKVGEEESVCAFDNLGGDARLVVPCPWGDEGAYPHLARFVREGPARQVDRLWQRVGEELRARVAATERPVWTSTSGLGVHWVHVRLDARPKYYVHDAYRRA